MPRFRSVTPPHSPKGPFRGPADSTSLANGALVPPVVNAEIVWAANLTTTSAFIVLAEFFALVWLSPLWRAGKLDVLDFGACRIVDVRVDGLVVGLPVYWAAPGEHILLAIRVVPAL